MNTADMRSGHDPWIRTVVSYRIFGGNCNGSYLPSHRGLSLSGSKQRSVSLRKRRASGELGPHQWGISFLSYPKTWGKNGLAPAAYRSSNQSQRESMMGLKSCTRASSPTIVVSGAWEVVIIEIESELGRMIGEDVSVVSRINFTHITISVYSSGSSPEVIGTRKRCMVHRSQDSCVA